MPIDLTHPQLAAAWIGEDWTESLTGTTLTYAPGGVTPIPGTIAASKDGNGFNWDFSASGSNSYYTAATGAFSAGFAGKASTPQDHSICFWIRMGVTGGFQYVMPHIFLGDVWDLRFGMYTSGGFPSVAINNGAYNHYSGITMLVNTWYHITLKIEDGLLNTTDVTLEIRTSIGTLLATRSFSVGAVLAQSNNSLEVKTDIFGAAGNQTVDIDELAFYGTALSNTQITHIMSPRLPAWPNARPSTYSPNLFWQPGAWNLGVYTPGAWGTNYIATGGGRWGQQLVAVGNKKIYYEALT